MPYAGGPSSVECTRRSFIRLARQNQLTLLSTFSSRMGPNADIPPSDTFFKGGSAIFSAKGTNRG